MHGVLRNVTSFQKFNDHIDVILHSIYNRAPGALCLCLLSISINKILILFILLRIPCTVLHSVYNIDAAETHPYNEEGIEVSQFSIGSHCQCVFFHLQGEHRCDDSSPPRCQGQLG